MDVGKIEDFLRELHGLCERHDVSVSGLQTEGGDVFSCSIGGVSLKGIQADRESAYAAYDGGSGWTDFEHDGEAFTVNGYEVEEAE